jgi:hypothetical protein
MMNISIDEQNNIANYYGYNIEDVSIEFFEEGEYSEDNEEMYLLSYRCMKRSYTHIINKPILRENLINEVFEEVSNYNYYKVGDVCIYRMKVCAVSNMEDDKIMGVDDLYNDIDFIFDQEIEENGELKVYQMNTENLIKTNEFNSNYQVIKDIYIKDYSLNMKAIEPYVENLWTEYMNDSNIAIHKMVDLSNRIHLYAAKRKYDLELDYIDGNIFVKNEEELVYD